MVDTLLPKLTASRRLEKKVNSHSVWAPKPTCRWFSCVSESSPARGPSWCTCRPAGAPGRFGARPRGSAPRAERNLRPRERPPRCCRNSAFHRHSHRSLTRTATGPRWTSRTPSNQPADASSARSRRTRLSHAETQDRPAARRPA